jgi:glycosyltransferase involved in cell wall biosynthesis
LKVALLSHEGGGISSVCYGLANSLARKKVETTVFSTTFEKRIRSEEVNHYLKIVHLPVIDFPPRVLWFNLSNLSRLLKLLEDFTLVHAVSPDMAFFYTLFKKQMRKPLITSLHGSPGAALKFFVQSPIRNWSSAEFALQVLEFPLHESTCRRCIDSSNRLIVCSRATLRELTTYEGLDPSKVSVIYNGVDLSEMPKDEAAKSKDGNYTLMYAGRLFPMKGIWFVLMAYRKLRMQFKNLNLRIFGKGPLESQIKHFVESEGLKNNVYFGGFLRHEELIKEIMKSDMVVFPSLYESQPMFVLETMACGKPLIAFDLPYAREIIKNEYNGLLAKPCDVDDLSNKITLVLQDKKLRINLGENAYEYVKKNHNWDVQGEKYLRVYEKSAIP